MKEIEKYSGRPENDLTPEELEHSSILAEAIQDYEHLIFKSKNTD